MPKIKYWSQKENKILQKYFAEVRKEKLLKLLPNRSWLAILAHGERMGLRRKVDVPRLKVNENYFKKWSSKMAYILGFIFADGGIVKITHNGASDQLGFGQHKGDIDILKKIKQELSAEQTLSISGNYVHFTIYSQNYSQKIVDDLKKLGVSYRKSSQIARVKIPKIPKKYLRDFIRGIVDGDGSINFDKRGYPTLSICGRKEIITFIRNHFFSKFNIYSKITRGKKNGKLMNLFYICYRTNSAKTLINYLYQNADLCLERKFQLAQIALMKKTNQEKTTQKRKMKLLKNFIIVYPKKKFYLCCLVETGFLFKTVLAI
jgi:hypothetical protein